MSGINVTMMLREQEEKHRRMEEKKELENASLKTQVSDLENEVAELKEEMASQVSARQVKERVASLDVNKVEWAKLIEDYDTLQKKYREEKTTEKKFLASNPGKAFVKALDDYSKENFRKSQ